jgi:hypothetical protein
VNVEPTLKLVEKLVLPYKVIEVIAAVERHKEANILT